MGGSAVAAFLSFLGVSVTAVFSWIAARANARSQREQAEVSSRGPDWKAFTDEIRTELSIQREQVSTLRSEVSALRAELDGVKNLYATALAYARDLFATHPDPGAPPEALKHEFEK